MRVKRGYTEDVIGIRNEFFASFKFQPVHNKNTPLETMPHYTDKRFEKEQTVFGKAEKGLHYDYSDRLWQWDHAKAKQASETANASHAVNRSARWYEEYLSAYFGKKTIIKHIVAGVNRSNGYPYCVFGYIFDVAWK